MQFVHVLRSFPRWFETLVVVATAFGLFIYSSTLELIDPSPILPSAGNYHQLVIQEIVVGAALLAFLIVRGWRFSDLGFASLRWMDIVHAGALVLAAVASYALIWTLITPPGSSNTVNVLDADGFNLSQMLALSVVNGAYEEIFVCAYLLAAWRSSPALQIIALSALLRLSYHLYQGPHAAIALFPLGILFAWYFASQRRVVPLIFAHITIDVIALLPYVASEN